MKINSSHYYRLEKPGTSTAIDAKSLVIIGAIGALLFGCATVYKKPGMTKAELEADRRDCDPISLEQARDLCRRRPRLPYAATDATSTMMVELMCELDEGDSYFKKCMSDRGYSSERAFWP